MAVKMRYNKNPEAVCDECWQGQQEVLNMFDLCIGDTIHTLCDVCVEKVFNKTLSAICEVNHRVKEPRDMRIIRQRKSATRGR